MWHISKGRSRTVIAVPSRGIVIKCARVRRWPLENLYKDVVVTGRMMLQGSSRKTKKMYLEFVGSAVNRALIQFFQGFTSNWRERSYYKRVNPRHRPFLQPTYFSLLGIFNIQKFGEPVNEARGEELYHRFFKVAGQALIHDGHHWTFAWNFHLAPDGPKILDYGSTETQKIISEYGIDLYTRFERK